MTPRPSPRLVVERVLRICSTSARLGSSVDDENERERAKRGRLPARAAAAAEEEVPIWERLERCKSCEHAKGEIVENFPTVCGVCNCPIFTKAMFSRCPLGRW